MGADEIRVAVPGDVGQGTEVPPARPPLGETDVIQDELRGLEWAVAAPAPWSAPT